MAYSAASRGAYLPELGQSKDDDNDDLLMDTRLKPVTRMTAAIAQEIRRARSRGFST